MKKPLWFAIFLMIGLILTACDGTADSQKVVLVPLDRSEWPTPVPAEISATATPFPVVDVAAMEAEQAAADAVIADSVAQQEALPVVAPTPTPEPPTPVPAEAAAAAAAEIASATTSESTTASETAGQAVTGTVSSFGLNLRSGPGAAADVVAELRQGTALTVLAVDEASGWLNVQTANNLVGWVNANFVDLAGDLDQVAENTAVASTNAAAPAASTSQNAVAAPAASNDEPLLIQLSSGGDIMVINRDGTGLRRLTSGIDPAISPDGSQVAFTRWAGTDPGSVWAINIDGTGERSILGETKQAKSPTWSPDGTQIAVNFQDGGTLQPREVCHPFSEGEPDLNFWQAYDIRVDFDTIGGERVPVALCWKYPADAHWRLRVINVNQQDYEDMPSSLYTFGPAWDPANDWRVVSSGGQGLIWTDVLRGEAEPLTDDPGDRGPTFSPDGQYIALTHRQNSNWDIHRLNADGNGRVRLTKTPLYAVVDGSVDRNNVAPAFSPDGTEIAFLTDRTGRWEVWVMNVDGSNQRPMFSAEINDQLPIQYDNNDERVISWGS